MNPPTVCNTVSVCDWEEPFHPKYTTQVCAPSPPIPNKVLIFFGLEGKFCKFGEDKPADQADDCDSLRLRG